MVEEICRGCGHSIRRHYQAVDGRVYCMVSDSGTSTSGVIGLPWVVECDCCDYLSKMRSDRMARERQKREELDAEWNAAADEMLKAVKERQS